MSWSERSKWIWVNESPIADSYGEFFDTFTYNDGTVTLRISADADYTLYINGELVAFGQYPDFPHYKVFDTVDVTAFCKAGENTVAIRVWHYGDFGTQTLTNFPGKAGVRYEFALGDTLLAFSDKNTASRLSKAYVNGYKKSITSQLGLSYCFDATKEDNWINGKGADFTDSVELPLDIPLYPRPIKKLAVGDRLPSICVKRSSGYALYDLGREEVGYLTFKVQSETPQKLKVCYGEHITDGCVRSEIDGRDFSFEICVPAGATVFTNYFRRLGARYLEIHSKADIKVEYLSVLPAFYPLDKKAKILKTPLRQQIYDVCVRTLELCMHDHYEDCPWREQGLYTMDSRNQMLCGYHAFREFAFARASLLLISKDDREDGLLSICAPSNMNLTIPSFSLHYFTEVYEYLLYSGDMSLANEIFPKLTSIMDVFLNRMQDGLVPAFEEWYHWNFYEWSEGLSGDRGTGGKVVWDAALNMLLSLALQNFQKICDMAGISAEYVRMAETINVKINERFYAPACGLYINTVGSSAKSELVNALAVLCGAATGDRAAKICETLAGAHDLTPASLSMVCFKYDALLAIDRERYAPYVLKDIEEKYKKMLDAGATSFWETEKGEADFSNAGSLCHGWSAMPVYYFHILEGEDEKRGTPVDIGTYMVAGDSTEIEDFPAYVGGKITAKDGRDGAKIYVVEDTSADQYATFLSSVEAAGWTKYTESDAGGNLFTTYTLGNHSVHTYYLPNVNRVHVIDMPLGAALPAAEAAAYTKVCEPLFTQVQLKYDAASEGDSYLLRLSDGRFIVVDGGMDEAEYYESEHLYALMQEQNVLDKITVAAWIVSHAHGDHHGTAGEFLGYYGTDDLTIEQIVFNYPSEDDLASMHTSATDTRYLTFLANMQKWVDNGTERVTCYTGQEFYYADARIEFVHTYEAFAPGVLDGADVNNTSSVFTIEIAGQKIMMLGDMHHLGSDSLVELYGEYLKSDIMKLAHHGYPGGTYELYNLIDPVTVFNSTPAYSHVRYYSEFRYYQKDTTRGGQAYWWLYDDKENPGYAYISGDNHVKEVITSGFKEVTVQLPYTPADGCEYFANRQNNGYRATEPAESDATVPTPYLDLLSNAQGLTERDVLYNGFTYTTDAVRVEKGDAVGALTSTVDNLSALVADGTSFEFFVAIDKLPDRPESAPYAMFGNSDIGLTLENPTLNVNLTMGDTKVLGSTGLNSRYWVGNVVGGNILNHIVGTYNADGTMSIYQNGVLVTTATYSGEFTIGNNVLTVGSDAFNALSGYTVLGARVYDECLTAEQVAATYWSAVKTVTAGDGIRA